jgi:integrase/recombinase XerD
LSEVQDCREEIINKLVIWAMRHGLDGREAKFDFYMMLNDVEITNRCTEVALLEEDRNEYLIKKFLVAKQVKGCTERTIKYYKECTIKFLDRIGKVVDDITADDIRYYMALRLRKDKVSKVTTGNEIRCVSSFFTWLHTEEIIPRNPMLKVDRIKKQKTKKEALTEIEIEKLRMAATGERDKLLIELLLSTGCRVSEVAQILFNR